MISDQYHLWVLPVQEWQSIGAQTDRGICSRVATAGRGWKWPDWVHWFPGAQWGSGHFQWIRLSFNIISLLNIYMHDDMMMDDDDDGDDDDGDDDDDDRW